MAPQSEQKVRVAKGFRATGSWKEMIMQEWSVRNRRIALLAIVVVSLIVVSTMIIVLQMELPEDTSPPSKVTGLEIHDLRDGKLFLFWDEATDNRKVVKYQIHRGGDLLPTEPSYPFYVDSALINGMLYFYRVRAVDSSGNIGELSEQSSGMPTPSDNVPPTRVEGLSVENAFDGKLNLTWEPAFDNVGVDRYRIYRDDVLLDDEPPTTSYMDTELTNNENYTYEVSAVDESGNEGQRSRSVSGIPKEYDPEPPSKVTGLFVVDARDGKLNLSWNQASDNVGVDRYFIYRDGQKLQDEPSATWYLDTGLVNGQTYSYRVSAVDFQGNEGPPSDSAAGSPTSSIPTVGVSGSFDDNVTYNITVFFVSEVLDLSLYSAILEVDWNPTDMMDPLVAGGSSGSITFHDMDSDGFLTVGDSFQIAVSAGHGYSFLIVWRATSDMVETHNWAVP